MSNGVRRGTSAWLAVACGLAALTGVARADVVVTLEESGGDVVATYAGSIDTAGSLGVYGVDSSTPFASIWPQGPRFELVSGSSVIMVSQFFSGPASFGSAGATPTGLISGRSFGFGPVDQEPGKFGFIVASDYQSGSALSGTATWQLASFSTLGITPGTYVWTTGTNTFTLTTNPVPEPVGGIMAAVGLTTAALGMRRRFATHAKS